MAALALSTGCGRRNPSLLASRGDFPSAWASALPDPWTSRLLEDPAAVLAAAGETSGSAALLQLSDGWALTVPRERLAPIGAAGLLQRLEPRAAAVSRLFLPQGEPALAFPWSSSPWILVLRSRPDLMERSAEGWDLLLEPSLAGRLVLPSSPRVSIALVDGDPARLRRLRRQALASDERDGLNLLLAGEAEAAVVPRQRVVPLLRRDPRLQVLLPASGAPLSWNLLLRPAGPHPVPPLEWLGRALAPPLLPKLLAAGWVPPLPRRQLEQALDGFPAPLQQLLLPPAAVLERCPDLPPLSPAERQRLQALWDEAAPASPSGGFS